MLTKPFNEDELWKGKTPKPDYSNTYYKAPMILPRYNPLTGYVKPERPSISEQIHHQYARYSAAYWEGVRIRQQIYRNNRKNNLYI